MDSVGPESWCISMVGELLLESAISAEASGHV
jgi:hypothetical protein